MKTIGKWIAIGILELVFCFWILDASATLVSSPSNSKVWFGLGGYLLGIVVIPGASITRVAGEINGANTRKKQLKSAFPGDETSIIQLLDIKE
ncbi:MAG: hypothetical protein SXA11_01605 [Cyanobacteriota bacterium]|nr:hypothetical protein [Cyanobacteriota bacterium]